MEWTFELVNQQDGIIYLAFEVIVQVKSYSY